MDLLFHYLFKFWFVNLKIEILLPWQIGPVNPPLHVHVKVPPAPTVQFPPFKHGFGLHGLGAIF